MFRNILVAIDGSPTATAALEEAIDLARSDGARLVLLSIAAPPRWRFTGPTYVPYPTDEELQRAAWDALARAEALVPADVPVSSIVRLGSPAAEIVARAVEGGHDLIVMGSRGHGLLGALLLGSVSRAVVARSAVPVLVSRRPSDGRPRAAEPRAHQDVTRERHDGGNEHAPGAGDPRRGHGFPVARRCVAARARACVVVLRAVVRTVTSHPARQHYNLTLAILTMAGTAFALQQTMVFPALSTFQREFDTTAAWATWVLTAFLLTASVATPLLGKLGDQYGKERMLVVALSIFLVGTVGGAFAWNIGSLIGFRALSGAGGAVFPLSFGIIRDEFPPEKVKVGIGLLSAVFGVGGGFGIVISGLIVEYLSWRWLFVAGAIPVGAAILLVHRYIPESPVKTRTRVDVPGAVLLAGALVALLVALTEGGSWGWSSPPFVFLIGASATLFAAWVLTELSVAEPMVDMRMMSHRPVLLTNTTA